MYDINSLIAIAFRVINFCFFICLMIYLFKKKVVGATQEKINEKEVYLQGLQEQERMLKNHYSRLEDQLHQQNENCQKLLEKIILWKSLQDNDIARKKSNYELNCKQVIARNECKEQCINKERFEKAALQEALSKTQEKLKEQFSQPEVGKLFVHDIIKALAKKELT